MKILSHETFKLHDLPENHPYKDVLEDSYSIDCDPEQLTLHHGMALIPIDDAIVEMPNNVYMCPMLDGLVIEHLNCQLDVWMQPDHDPSVLYHWIQKSLNLPNLTIDPTWPLSTLIQNNPPLHEYISTNNLLSVYGRLTRTLLLQHIQSLGITEVEFEFLFITKE